MTTGGGLGRAVLVVAVVAGCTTDSVDGFTAVEWEVIQTLSPLPERPACPVEGDCAAAARVGQRLFFDPRYSGAISVAADGANGGLGPVGATGLIACASCHNPRSWFYDLRSHPNETTLGAAWSTRNTPSLVNAALLQRSFTWTGRFSELVEVPLAPVTKPELMNSSPEAVAALLDGDAQYAMDLAAIFPGDGDRFAQFKKLLFAYERELVSGDAPFDRYVAGEAEAISEPAKRGLKLFIGDGLCLECHHGPLFTDEDFHSVGVAQAGTYVPAVDLGRGGLMGHEAEAGRFRTAPLRNVARTPPYMHTGQLASLAEVVWHYQRGGDAGGYAGVKDPLIMPLDLDDQDVLDLVAFLESLNGAEIAPDLLEAP